MSDDSSNDSTPSRPSPLNLLGKVNRMLASETTDPAEKAYRNRLAKKLEGQKAGDKGRSA